MLYLEGWLLCSLALSALGCSSLAHSGKPVSDPWVVRENAGYCQTRWTSLATQEEPYPVQLSQRPVGIPSDELAVIVSAREPQLLNSSQGLTANDAAPLQLEASSEKPVDSAAVREAEYVRPASFDYFQP